MPDYSYMREIARLARDHGPIKVDNYELRRMFRQKERETPLGDAIMKFCGLPTEKETFERWLVANELVSIPDHKSGDCHWLGRKAGASDA